MDIFIDNIDGNQIYTTYEQDLMKLYKKCEEEFGIMSFELFYENRKVVEEDIYDGIILKIKPRKLKLRKRKYIRNDLLYNIRNKSDFSITNK